MEYDKDTCFFCYCQGYPINGITKKCRRVCLSCTLHFTDERLLEALIISRAKLNNDIPCDFCHQNNKTIDLPFCDHCFSKIKNLLKTPVV